MRARNNLHVIASAFALYAEQHDGRLPPAAIRDRAGRPLLSWRVLILPYLEAGDLYPQFRLDEPWDSPHNLALLPRMPKVYAVPSGPPREVPHEPHATFLQVFTGRGTAFEADEGVRLDDFPGGADKTLLLVEAGEAVPWTKPADLAYAADRPVPPLGGVFSGETRLVFLGCERRRGSHVATADGAVRFLGKDTGEAVLRSLITRGGPKVLDEHW